MTRLVSALLATALLAAPALAATGGEADRIRAIVADPRGSAAPGCATGVFRRGETLFVSTGATDLATGKAADADTLFYTASVAKQFTALAAAQLVARGKIGLDDDIRRYVPEMPRTSPKITVAMLMHHTSGVKNELALMEMAGFHHWNEASRQDILSLLFQYPSTSFPPGTTYEYSNGAFTLLTEIVQRVTGRPFDTYMESEVLRPMGMTRSRIFDGSPRQVRPDIAHGYEPKEGGFELSDGYALVAGAGGMLTSINDLARYVADFNTGHRVWTPAVTKIMTEPGRYADGSPVIASRGGFGYGGGLNLSRDWVFHEGGAVGFKTFVGWAPARDFGVALLCNRSDVKPTKLAIDIAAALDPALPKLDTPRFALPPRAGHFVSRDLPVTYDIADTPAGLDVTVVAPSGKPREVLHMTKTAEDAYAAGPVTLIFDVDHRGLRVSSYGQTAARFAREPEKAS